MKSYSGQISELTKKAFRLYSKKMQIKDSANNYRLMYQNNQLTKEGFEYRMHSLLKGYDEYKVYEMYDNYISYLVNKMRSYSDGIFNYLVNHKVDVELIIKTEEDIKKEMEKERRRKLHEKKLDEKDQKEGWDAKKADTFVKKKVVKKTPLDKFAQKINVLFFKKKVTLDQLMSTKEAEDYKNKSQFSLLIDNITELILGKQNKSLFDKGRSKNKGLKDLENKYSKKEFLGRKTALSTKFKNVRKIKYDNVVDKKNLGLMSQQSSFNFIDSLLSKKDNGAGISYVVSSYSALANITMKDISVEFINAFPIFFKTLYKNLRYANMHFLSSTYTNMMLLSSLLGGFGVMFFTFLLSFMSFAPLPTILANSFLGLVFGSSASFMGHYFFPAYKKNDRSRNINANLPFAIDHMAAVIGAGVSPSAMFSLISQSKEYGEVSVELEKVVEYVELFGYDVLTAIESVANFCPSRQMKEFFEGFVTTIQSGGDLKKYLRDIADSSMLHYRLERQKYNDSISTFSDIYTGLMVASPLFFVAPLSMVSILGGTVGDVDITTLMVVGTYIVIPLINLVFMVFMELTQPTL